MEDLDHLRAPAPTYSRPAGLGTLGANSYLLEPFKIRSAHRVHIGREVGIDERSVLSVLDEFQDQAFEAELWIGDRCRIGPDLYLACASDVEIGCQVAIGARVFILNAYYDFEGSDLAGVDLPMGRPASMRIRDGAFLGPGAVILSGITIGERAVVLAGSVVTEDVPPRTVVAGNPARVVRSSEGFRLP